MSLRQFINLFLFVSVDATNKLERLILTSIENEVYTQIESESDKNASMTLLHNWLTHFQSTSESIICSKFKTFLFFASS
jgi:hypothetical protein